MNDPRLVCETRRRIDNCDYDAVFTGGACFIFALRLNERFQYEICGCRYPNRPQCWLHVWAKKGEHGIDVHGMYPQPIIAALANGGSAIDPVGVTVDDINAEIVKKGYSDDLLKELSLLADHIFDTHERFVLARPVKSISTVASVIAEFEGAVQVPIRDRMPPEISD
jgi:hypothetical protein